MKFTNIDPPLFLNDSNILWSFYCLFFYLLSCSDSESEKEDDKTTRYKLYSNTILLQSYYCLSECFRMITNIKCFLHIKHFLVIIDLYNNPNCWLPWLNNIFIYCKLGNFRPLIFILFIVFFSSANGFVQTQQEIDIFSINIVYSFEFVQS